MQIPTASRSCPQIPKAQILLLGRDYELNYDICSEAYYIGGRHPLELLGLIIRAAAAISAVFIVLGAVSSINAGLHKMRMLGQ